MSFSYPGYAIEEYQMHQAGQEINKLYLCTNWFSSSLLFPDTVLPLRGSYVAEISSLKSGTSIFPSSNLKLFSS